MGFWRNEFTKDEIQFVLEKLQGYRKIESTGRISLSRAGEVRAWISLLVSALGIEVRSDSLRRRIVQDVLFSSDLSENFTRDDFQRLAYKLRNKYQDHDVSSFKIVFPIWNLPDFLGGTKRIGDVTLNFTPSVNSRFYKKAMQERERQRSNRAFEYHFSKETHEDLSRCQICIAQVRANNATDANERASEAIYEVLGLVNLAKDAGKSWRQTLSGKPALPVSEVLIGPHTTTHHANGTLTHDGFWRENWVGGPKKSIPKTEVMQAWAARYAQLQIGVDKSLWRKKCKEAAVRYFVAFSNPNLEDAFLDGWRLFENVTGSRTEKIANQIYRTSNVFQDYVEHRIIGKHLALRRNLISHGHAIKTSDNEILVFQMLQFVVPYLEMFILNHFKIGSLKKFWEFLDLPESQEARERERATLKKRLTLLDHAAYFRGETC